MTALRFKDGWLWLGESPIAHVVPGFEKVALGLVSGAEVSTQLATAIPQDFSSLRLLQVMARETSEQLNP